MRNIVIVDDVYSKVEINAGSKARNDINKILSNYKHEYFYIFRFKFFNILHLLYECMHLKHSQDIFIVHYPHYFNEKTTNVIKKSTPQNSILLIHDILPLRDNADINDIKTEIQYINQYPCVISHNASMTEWLKNNGCTSHIIDLELFDYLVDTQTRSECSAYKRNNTVAFAGNLDPEKSGFLYKNIQIMLKAYGGKFDKNNASSNIQYCGVFPANELPDRLSADFGLVWDGNSADVCGGNFGNYLKYNNPHKVSLYIASGLPIIIWEQAALAKLVERYNVGITIGNLNEIPAKIKSISDEEYNMMRLNAYELSEKLRNGYFTKKAIHKAVEYVESIKD